MNVEINSMNRYLYLKGFDELDQVYIRLGNEGDCETIRELFEMSFPVNYDEEYYGSLRSQEYRGNRLIIWMAESFEQNTCNPVGCIVMQKRLLGSSNCDIHIIQRYSYDYALYILNIAVFPKYKRRGIGSFLLQKAIEFADNNQQCAGVYLNVQASNQGNIHFYEVNGFKCIMNVPGCLLFSEVYCVDTYIIDGHLEDSKLYFYPLHGALATSSQLYSDGIPYLLFGVLFSFLLIAGYKIIS